MLGRYQDIYSVPGFSKFSSCWVGLVLDRFEKAVHCTNRFVIVNAHTQQTQTACLYWIITIVSMSVIVAILMIVMFVITTTITTTATSGLAVVGFVVALVVDEVKVGNSCVFDGGLCCFSVCSCCT